LNLTTSSSQRLPSPRAALSVRSCYASGSSPKAADVGVTLGADAILAALHGYGGIALIAVVTPYMPAGDEKAVSFFTESGFEVVNIKGLQCGSPVLIAHTSEAELRDAIIEVDGPQVDAVVLVGTNLPMSRAAGVAEFWLGKPVIALNTATYWHALRQNGITDKVQGFGRLLAEL
jgi:maleate isomerase